MEIDIIIQYVMTILPSVVSIVSGLGTVVVVIMRIKRFSKKNEASLSDSLNELSKDNKDLKRSLYEAIGENAALKRQMNRLMARMEQNEKQAHQKPKGQVLDD